jgi:hypothetical protein
MEKMHAVAMSECNHFIILAECSVEYDVLLIHPLFKFALAINAVELM